jgi:hypothetical protein
MRASSLAPGQVYNLTVNVTDDMRQYITGYATIYVKRSDLVVKISGGDRIVRSSTAVTISAADSFDPDDRSAALDFAWTCILGGEFYGQPCGLASSVVLTSSTLQAGRLTPSRIYMFSVRGASRDGRSGSASVTLTVTASSPPMVSIGQLATPGGGSVTSLSKVNPTTKLSVVGYMDLADSVSSTSTNITLSWTVVSGSFSTGGDLSSVARSATSVDVNAATYTASNIYPLPLMIEDGGLLGGSSYTLLLRATDRVNRGLTSFAQISFATNSPPSSGSLSVRPQQGFVITTGFTLTATSWVDDATDYPLKYSFYYK